MRIAMRNIGFVATLSMLAGCGELHPQSNGPGAELSKVSDVRARRLPAMELSAMRNAGVHSSPLDGVMLSLTPARAPFAAATAPLVRAGIVAPQAGSLLDEASTILLEAKAPGGWEPLVRWEAEWTTPEGTFTEIIGNGLVTDWQPASMRRKCLDTYLKVTLRLTAKDAMGATVRDQRNVVLYCRDAARE